jgi:excisionase family DNA binding protein
MRPAFAAREVDPIGLEPIGAVKLLTQFFAEEGFDTAPSHIERNVVAMLNDPMCCVALAMDGDEAVGVVAVTTMRYVEWGLVGEIGDLYVLPDRRRAGVARALIAMAMDWCLSVAQFAKLFGITRPGVYALLNRGVIKGIRIGNRRLIPCDRG